ncbi:MAG: serine hydrolase [Bacteroidetes bacterium]|nr:serine hydrolase [Bacteroidota bacterium]
MSKLYFLSFCIGLAFLHTIPTLSAQRPSGENSLAKEMFTFTDKVCQGSRCFSIKLFGENLQKALNGVSMSHTYAIVYNDKVQNWGQTGQARRTQDGMVYNLNALTTKMNVASCAKTMTAIALLRLLESKNVSLDASIKDYLPQWWSFGKNIELITFRNILTQKSGFQCNAENYWGIKKIVETGIEASHHAAVNTCNNNLACLEASGFCTSMKTTTCPTPNCKDGGTYRNLNFCIMRLLVPALAGKFNYKEKLINPNPNLMASLGQKQDAASQAAFMATMQELVWNPLGVSAGCDNPDDVMYYDYTNPNLKGFDTGKECQNAGGGTISISVAGLARVMHAARFTNKLLSEKQGSFMFNSLNPLGCYASNEDGGKDWGGHFHHNGGFKIPREKDAVVSASCWYTFHNGITVAVSSNCFKEPEKPELMTINKLIEQAFDNSWL